MTAAGLLIVGASQAGVQLAISVRALGYPAPVTLLGDENHRPYQRPALSKEFLRGAVGRDSLIFRTQQYWDEQRITVVKNERITRIDRVADGSGVAHAASGHGFAFDRLALAVGARARRLAVEGADLDGVGYLRDADDALWLRARLPSVRDVVVIGGGLIGLEAAASLRALGRTVTVVEAGPSLAGRVLGPPSARFLLDHHRRQGTTVRLGASVSRILGSGGQVAAVEVDGERLPADLVLVGIGVVPNTELAQGLGLHCDDGIRVDAGGRASDGTTIAIGDCANGPSPAPGAAAGERLRLESVNNAIEQAKVAAHTIAGPGEAHPGVPWFWSDQGSVKLQIAGLIAGHDRTLVRRDDPDGGRFCALYYRGATVLAAECVNSPLDFLAVKAALARRAGIPYERAADPDTPLKDITSTGIEEP